MLPLPGFELLYPENLTDALHVLEESPQDTVLMAGGTDLVPNLKHGLHAPRRVVSLAKVPELYEVQEGSQGLEVGAGLTLSEISQHPVVRRNYSAVAKAAGQVASPQIRNRATLGGNLCLDTRCVYYNQTEFWRRSLGYCLKKDGTVCHVVPEGSRCVAAFSADTPGPLMMYGAVVRLMSPRGAREVALAKFYRGDGVRNTVREPDEIVTSVLLPPSPPQFKGTYRKLRYRNSIDFPLVSLALGAEVGKKGLGDLRIVVGGLGAKPRVITGLEKIIGESGGPSELSALVESRVFDQCHPLENLGSEAPWRREVIRVLVRRSLSELILSA